MDCSTPGFPVLHYLPEFVQTHVHWVYDAVQTSHSLLPYSPPALSLPSIRVFSNESALCIMWPKDWSFRFSISSSGEYSGLISFRIDWFDLLAVQGTPDLNTTVQKHQFFCAQTLWSNSHPYMTTGKPIALTRQTFVGKVMSLLLNTLSRFVIAFPLRSNCLLVSWLQSPWLAIHTWFQQLP